MTIKKIKNQNLINIVSVHHSLGHPTHLAVLVWVGAMVMSPLSKKWMKHFEILKKLLNFKSENKILKQVHFIVFNATLI